MKVEISKSMRPPLNLGWKIDDPGDDELIDIVKLIDGLGFSLVVLNLNSWTSRSRLSGQNPPKTPSQSRIFSSDGSLDVLKNFIPLGRSDLALSNDIWSQRVVSFIKTNSFDILKTQIEWSCYVSAHSILIDLEAILAFNDSDVSSETGKPMDVLDRLVHFCQIVSSYLSRSTPTTIWLSMDFCNQSWNTWYMVYELCSFSEKLKVCLKLNPLETEIGMWQAEPVKCVIVSAGSFSRKGDKVKIDKNIADYLLFFMSRNLKVIVDCDLDYRHLVKNPVQYSVQVVPEEKTSISAQIGIRDILVSLRKIYAKLGPMTVQEHYGQGYEDVLQLPLQPLRDNLDSVTYNEFEKCSFKYKAYNTAINLFLVMCGTSCKTQKIFQNERENMAHINCSKEHTLSSAVSRVHYCVYVVGAGRGPLVDITQELFKRNGITNFTVYVIDKNPYTMMTLQDKMRIKEWSNVKLICTDMRYIKDVIRNSGTCRTEGTREDVVLIISELLGPFGDNELAPECLYGFERNLRPSDKIQFIPESYTSYVMPLHAPQIWAKIKSLFNYKSFHMPYTVFLRSCYSAATEFMECFTFEHPGPGLKENYKNQFSHGTGEEPRTSENYLERYRVVKFVAANDCYVHGFGAYFKCTLFDDVQISILPEDTENIKSWFPMFFPIEIPFPVKKSQVIALHVWRKTDPLRVWYEWAFTTPTTTAIHNVNGFSFSISKN
ncbi:type II protein arginine methyltransferase [Theileria orientalis]|uniref:Protein arginine N-methyltransferase n=1 Tax=Theileria orientalis TaxID=68886 RepID=A0A976M3H4_THEOR|nr:type II protein arginine methyltransferase [Theileria orientalis]